MGLSLNQVPATITDCGNMEQQPLKCPRCESTNTKFCYFNNYSRSQPRHHCRVCKRYWTAGGTLRNVPVGGRSKMKRSSKTSPKSKRKIVQKVKSVNLKPSVANHVIENFDGVLEQKVDAQVVVLQKLESSGGKSIGFDQKDDVLEIRHCIPSFRSGSNEVCDVLQHDIVNAAVDCSTETDQLLLDHEIFSFELLPETCDLMKLPSNEAVDQQQLQMDMIWELDDPGALEVSDYIDIDVPEIMQSWDL